jgi:UDP-N-acetylglucosamine 2-epimerase (non-hydrolysing)/GDP/UDP-N,N'-diacetylbacillosamine 2-epimerase (hydrolysing)
MNKKICVVTGTRAEYGIMKALIRSISNSSNLDLQIVVTGNHIAPEFGYTKNDIINDGFKIDAEVPMIVSGNTKQSMAMSIGVGIIGMTPVFNQFKPDIVVVLGDRFEILAAAISAVYSGYILAHLAGGDSAAGYDEYTRHAITKIAHLHFPFTKKCADRIIRMGEDPKTVFLTGSPAIDTILHFEMDDELTIKRKYSIPEELDYCLLVQHPLSTDPLNAKNEINATLKAIDELNIPTLIIYPNVDPGSYSIIELIEEYADYHNNVILCKNIPFEEYLALMKYASVMIGNSSSAILEAPSFCVPVVNIGNRQNGREQGGNVINAPPETDKILNAIKIALFDKNFREKVKKSKNPYGDGFASEKIVKILEEIVIDNNLYQKQICY